MKYLMQLLMLCIFTVCANEPVDMRIAAYEQFKGDAKEQIKAILDEEFSQDMEFVKRLNTPFPVGEMVVVTVRKGLGTQTIRGVFKGIEREKYARIDQRTYLKDDIDELDWKRLYYGMNRGRLAFEVNELRLSLAEKRARRETVEMEKLIHESGYSEKFFGQVLAVNGEYRYRKHMGDRTILLEIRDHPSRSYLSARLVNNTDKNLKFMLLIGSKVVAASELFHGGEKWKSAGFRLKREQVPGSLAKLSKSLKIFCFDSKVGSWLLVPRPTNVTPGRTNSKPCPECDGTQKSLDRDGKTVIHCPGANAQATIPLLEPVRTSEITYMFRLNEDSIRPPTAKIRNEFGKAPLLAKRYAIEIQRQIFEEKKVARVAREQEDDTANAEQQSIATARLEREQLAASRESFDRAYRWLTPEGARAADSVGDKLPRKTVIKMAFDDIAFPTAVQGDNRRVYGFTSWRNAKSLDHQSYYALKYRLLRVGQPGSSREATKTPEEEELPPRSRYRSSRSPRPARVTGLSKELVSLDQYGKTLADVEYWLQYRLTPRERVSGSYETKVLVKFPNSEQTMGEVIKMPAAGHSSVISGVEKLELPESTGRIKIVEVTIDGTSEDTEAAVEVEFLGPEVDETVEDENSGNKRAREFQRLMRERAAQKKREAAGQQPPPSQ